MPTDNPSPEERPGPPQRISCPQCKAQYLTHRPAAGRRVRCRQCNHVWRFEPHVAGQVANALEYKAAGWLENSSTRIQAPDHASTLGHLASAIEKAPKTHVNEWIGRTLGRYHIDSVLGRGAMGYVYEATDRLLNRSVALKLLPLRIEDERSPIGLKMFLQEARVAARLQHPNIVTVYEAGSENGIHYFAMERVHGVTLARLVEDQGALPANQVCYVGAHAAMALAVGHRQGIVHRDMKPGNVMITNDGQVKLTDFGLAHVEGIDQIKELADRPLGTPGWISPEVARGERATPASDIFSLGLALHYALTGDRLLRAKTTSGLVRLHRSFPGVRQSELPLNWPPRLRDIIVQCLQPAPEGRYQSAETLATDLARALVPGEDDATMVLSPDLDPPPPITRRRVPGHIAWTLVAISVLGVIALGYLFWIYLR